MIDRASIERSSDFHILFITSDFHLSEHWRHTSKQIAIKFDSHCQLWPKHQKVSFIIFVSFCKITHQNRMINEWKNFRDISSGVPKNFRWFFYCRSYIYNMARKFVVSFFPFFVLFVFFLLFYRMKINASENYALNTESVDAIAFPRGERERVLYLLIPSVAPFKWTIFQYSQKSKYTN